MLKYKKIFGHSSTFGGGANLIGSMNEPIKMSEPIKMFLLMQRISQCNIMYYLNVV